MGLQLGSHPLFQRLASFGNARVFSRGKEVADDLRERWETSESPLVHRIPARPPIWPSRPSHCPFPSLKTICSMLPVRQPGWVCRSLSAAAKSTGAGREKDELLRLAVLGTLECNVVVGMACA